MHGCLCMYVLSPSREVSRVPNEDSDGQYSGFPKGDRYGEYSWDIRPMFSHIFRFLSEHFPHSIQYTIASGI